MHRINRASRLRLRRRADADDISGALGRDGFGLGLPELGVGLEERLWASKARRTKMSSRPPPRTLPQIVEFVEASPHILTQHSIKHNNSKRPKSRQKPISFLI
jgi:hypothetical protein